jgi:ABC-2 type transport system ATP-binding protein
VAIITDGRIAIEGAPADLGANGEAPRYRVAYRNGTGREVEQETDDPTTLLHELTGAALARDERLEGLAVTRPTLEDVYLQLTAGEPEEADAAVGEAARLGARRRRRRR